MLSLKSITVDIILTGHICPHLPQAIGQKNKKKKYRYTFYLIRHIDTLEVPTFIYKRDPTPKS